MASTNNVPNVSSVYPQTNAYNSPYTQPTPPPTQQNLPLTTGGAGVSIPGGGGVSSTFTHPIVNAHLPGPFASTGSITNSLLPASVVDDAHASTSVTFASTNPSDAYVWTDNPPPTITKSLPPSQRISFGASAQTLRQH